MAAVTEEAMAEVITMAAVTEEAMAEVIPNLRLPILIDLLVQKVGKIEVMVTLLKTLNTKVVEVGEKEVFLMKVKSQMSKISNPFPRG